MSLRVINGDDANLDDAPWQAAVFVDNGFACGAVVIAPSWVATAAHCLFDRNGYPLSLSPERVKIVTKTDSVKRSVYNIPQEKVVGVERMLVHPEYTEKTFKADLAVVKLSRSVSSPAVVIADSRVQQRMESVAGDREDMSLQLTGWGSIRATGEGISNRLQKAHLSLVSDLSCATAWGTTLRDVAGYQQAYVCTNSSRFSTCFGDSGGPLVWTDPDRVSDADRGKTLVGIVSFSAGQLCGQGVAPDVFTQASTYSGWMENCVAGKSCDFKVASPNLNSQQVGTQNTNSSGGAWFFLPMLLLNLWRR
ncbi:S1 family peptidase [Veronia nyctiphanis]|nr:serine protease [Veronia nyctiphanis]